MEDFPDRGAPLSITIRPGPPMPSPGSEKKRHLRNAHRISGGGGRAAVGLAVLTSVGLVLIVWRGLRTGRLLDDTLSRGPGTGWRTTIESLQKDCGPDTDADRYKCRYQEDWLYDSIRLQRTQTRSVAVRFAQSNPTSVMPGELSCAFPSLNSVLPQCARRICCPETSYSPGSRSDLIVAQRLSGCVHAR